MAANYQAVVQQLRERVDIVALIGRHVSLKRSGASFKGCCPFHQEKTPSFFVHPDKQFYYCFGCGAKGDAFSFLMDYEGKRFPEVVQELADEYNIPLPDQGYGVEQNSEEDQKREQIYQLNHWARQFFVEQLHSEAGQETRDYLQSRGVSEEMVEAFGLGYAPDDWGALKEHFQSRDVPPERGCEAGLLKQSEKSDRIYDRFRHRLMFPIILPSGRVAGFGGRVLRKDDGAKYLNSPESLVFKKSQMLYGMELASPSIRKQQVAVLVEGYLDVICMHQFGFTHTVAALGTSFTEDHLHQLRRHTKRVLLLFDGDKAGFKAAERALQVLIPGGFSVDVLILPDGEDPDTYLHKHGHEAMLSQLEDHKQPAFDFWLDALYKRADDDPIQVRDATKVVLDLLQKVDDNILRDLYLKRLAARFGVEESELRRGLMHVVPRPSATTRFPQEEEPPLFPQEADDEAGFVSFASFDTLLIAEQATLSAMIKVVVDNPDMFSFLAQAERIHKLHDPLLRQTWSQLISALQEDPERPSAVTINSVLDILAPLPQYQKGLAQVLMKDPPFEKDTLQQIWQDLSNKLDSIQIERKLRQLDEEIKEATKAQDEEALLTLVPEKMALRRAQLERRSQRTQVEETPLFPQGEETKSTLSPSEMTFASLAAELERR